MCFFEGGLVEIQERPRHLNISDIMYYGNYKCVEMQCYANCTCTKVSLRNFDLKNDCVKSMELLRLIRRLFDVYKFFSIFI